MRREDFRGNHDLTIFAAVFSVIGIILGINEQGFNSNIIKGVGIAISMIFFFYTDDLLTYVHVIDRKVLKSRFGYGKAYTLTIQNITKIDRGAVFKFKSWGSRMEIYSIDERGDEARVRAIQESAYSVETIKKILLRLKELNPNIILDPQYQDLIDGKIKDEKKFKDIPPTIH